MKIILLSGGSGQRLWPLSNDVRSKQFLRVLRRDDGEPESMIQRVVRQIKETGLADEIVVATGVSQKDAIENQLGDGITIVTEPSRRNTFPAIALACSYLADEGAATSEPVVVMPCDSYTENAYFATVGGMAEAIAEGVSDLVLMGVRPTYPSAKYGYILPADTIPSTSGAVPVRRFTEKPDTATAERLIAEGALWNGGVFAFRLGYMLEIIKRRMGYDDYAGLREHYDKTPRISFDYEVIEKAKSVSVIPYDGDWRDLGTWRTLTDELRDLAHGNVILDSCESTYVINELEIPLVCIGAKDFVVAASPDGILVSERNRSEAIKHLVSGLNKRPMYEKRRWGEYKVIDNIEFHDGFCALTKQLTLEPGKSISYQRHNCRNEVWTFINGEGIIVLDGERRKVGRGDVINIAKGQMHALKAITPLTFIEVQHGSNLIEEDIERFPYEW